MKLIGRIFDGKKYIQEAIYEKPDDETSLRDRLEEALITVCRQLNISVPLWLGRNTKEFVHFQKTVFLPDQFIDEVKFVRFEIRMEQS